MNQQIYAYLILFQVFIVANVRVLSQHQQGSNSNLSNPSYQVPPLLENYPPDLVNAPPPLLPHVPQTSNGQPPGHYVPPLFPNTPPFLPNPVQPLSNALPPPIVSMAPPVPPNIPLLVRNELVPVPDPAPPLASDVPTLTNTTSPDLSLPKLSLNPAPRIQDPVPQASSLQVHVQGSPNQGQATGAQFQQGQTSRVPQNEQRNREPPLVNNQRVQSLLPQPQVQSKGVDGQASSYQSQAHQQQKQQEAQQLQNLHQQLQQQQLQQQQLQQQQLQQQQIQQHQIYQQPYQHPQPVYEYEQPELQQVSKFGTMPSPAYGASASMYGQRPEYEAVELEAPTTPKPQPMVSAYNYQPPNPPMPQPMIPAYTYQPPNPPMPQAMVSAYSFQPPNQPLPRPQSDSANVLKARILQLQRMAQHNKRAQPVQTPAVGNADPRLLYFLHSQHVLAQQRKMLSDSLMNYRPAPSVQYASQASPPAYAYQAPPTFQGGPSSGSVREVYEMLSNGEMKCKNLYRIHNIDSMRHASSVCGQGLRCPAPYSKEVQMGNFCMCCPYLDQATMTSLQQRTFV